jgi:alkylhydroperoxidase family enzyme
MCKLLNVNEGDIQKVLEKATNLNPKRVKLSIAFSKKMAINPESIVEADHHILLDSGLTKSQIFELMALVSLVNYSNTLAQGIMIDVDQKVVSLLNNA